MIDPERFPSEQVSEDHQLRTVADLTREYEKGVALTKRGGDKEKYELRILQRTPLLGMSLKGLRAHQISKFREDRLQEVSTRTVRKDLGLLSALINTGRTEWGLENLLKTNPVS